MIFNTENTQRQFLFFCMLLFLGASKAQDYSWQHGSNALNQNGVYGVQGTPANANMPGGRSAGATWRDNTGNLWLFSGYGHGAFGSAGPLDDLWKFNITTKQWTWVKGSNNTGSGFGQSPVYGTQGVANAANTPGSRISACTWVDNAGNLWLFGGKDPSTTGVDYNDLWKYNVSTNQWTWMHGDNSINMYGQYGTYQQSSPTNKPGARHSCMSWKDGAGNLWMFGGEGRSSGSLGYLNDLWMYNISNNRWVWMFGAQISDVLGYYGTKGVQNINNEPGARMRAHTWTDNAGNLWLFGGFGYNDQFINPANNLHDLWRFNTSTLQWTWMNGTSGNAPGVYGTKGVAAAGDTPGIRNSGVAWKDAAGNFWLFGGRGYPDNYVTGTLSDLWKYEVGKNQWTWMEGTKVTYQAGMYGSVGIPNPNNSPGARELLMNWTDLSGNLWLFGGSGRATTTTNGLLNDLWKYDVCNAPQAPSNINSSQSLSICEGETTELKATAPGAINWYDVSTGGLAIATGTSYVTPPLTITTTYYAETDGCMPSTLRTSVTVNVSACTGLYSNAQETVLFTVYPNPGRGVVNINAKRELSLILLNSLGQRLRLIELTHSNNYTAQLNDLASGVYILQGTDNGNKVSHRVVVSN